MKKICVFIMMSLLVCSAAGCGREKTNAETGRREVTETGAELLQEKTDFKTDEAGAKGETDSEADETDASDEADASGREDIKVYGCDLLTQKKAERIGDEIYDIIHGARGAYQFENERIVFTQQRESDGMVTVQAAYYGDWKIAMPLVQLPQIQGMLEAAKELETDEEVCAATLCIYDQLLEYYGHYLDEAGETTMLDIEVRFAQDSADDAYELYDVSVRDGEEREEPFADSMEPDTEALKQMGREMLQNGLEAHGVSFCRRYLGIE